MKPHEIADWAQELNTSLQRQLQSVESSSARRLTLDASFANLGRLPLKQDELFREALRCVEEKLYRPAHVMAWAAFIDLFHEFLAATSLSAIQTLRPKWNVSSPEDFRSYSDFSVIEAARDAKAIPKTVAKALHGLLNKRNECAHPEDYHPGLNDTLGYVDELFKRAEHLLRKAGPGSSLTSSP